MEFHYGATRRVVLVGKWAIKIARFRPFHSFVRFFQILFNGETAARVAKYETKSFFKASLQHLGAGMLANRAEYHLYSPDVHCALVPVRGIFLGGLVLIQDRGTPAKEKDIPLATEHPLWGEMLREAGSPELAVRQFCLFDGKIFLSDYGRADLGIQFRTLREECL